MVAAGGLHIVGTERHESRRIDNQLRGRAGRQGDPGISRFFLSLQDDLLRIFGGDRIQSLMLRLGMEEDVPIESRLITKRIEAAQKAVEAQNFAARKHLLEYDDVMNKQRQAVYGMRRQLLEGVEQKERIFEIVDGIVGSFVDMRCPENDHPDKWDLTGAADRRQFPVRPSHQPQAAGRAPASRDRSAHHRAAPASATRRRKRSVGADVMRETERMIMLHVIDDQWKDHLLSMDHLKEGIGLRGYGQKDPLVEYKKESFSPLPGHDGPHRGRNALASSSSSNRCSASAPMFPSPRAVGPTTIRESARGRSRRASKQGSTGLLHRPHAQYPS